MMIWHSDTHNQNPSYPFAMLIAAGEMKVRAGWLLMMKNMKHG